MSRFGGAPKCPACGKSVYPAERVTYNTKDYHKFCLKCSVCKKTLSPSAAVGDKGVLYCMPCYKKFQASEAARVASEAEAQAAMAPPPAAGGYDAAPAAEEYYEEQPAEQYEEQPAEEQY